MSTTKNDFRLSFEFFPPKTDKGREKLKGVRAELNNFKPEFFSVTYGAGGSTRENTLDVVKEMRAEGLNIAPHLSFGGDNEETMLELLNEYKALGVTRIVALRGDMPSGIGSSMQLVYANQLVEFIRKHTGDHFHLEVAAYPEIHPESSSYLKDIRYLKAKFDAGANSAITQYFFNPDAYFYFIDECAKEGITQAIYPGIMPITNYRNLARFSENCGAEIPRWIRKKLASFDDNPEAISAFGEEVISLLCEKLLAGGAPGLHFYSMNSAEPNSTIVNHLRR